MQVVWFQEEVEKPYESDMSLSRDAKKKLQEKNSPKVPPIPLLPVPPLGDENQ